MHSYIVCCVLCFVASVCTVRREKYQDIMGRWPKGQLRRKRSYQNCMGFLFITYTIKDTIIIINFLNSAKSNTPINEQTMISSLCQARAGSMVAVEQHPINVFGRSPRLQRAKGYRYCKSRVFSYRIWSDSLEYVMVGDIFGPFLHVFNARVRDVRLLRMQ